MPRRLSPVTCIALASLATCASCTSSDAGGDGAASVDAAPPCALAIELGPPGPEAFTPFRAGDEAPLVLGFQGFRYIVTRLRARGARGGQVSLRFDVAVEGYERALQDGGTFLLMPAGGDLGVANDVQIFFNDIPAPGLVDRRVQVVAQARSGGCTAQAALDVRLGSPMACDDAGVCDAATICDSATSCDATGE